MIIVDSAFCQEATFLLVERPQFSYITKIMFSFSICSVHPPVKATVLIFSHLIPMWGLWEVLRKLYKKVFYYPQFKVLKKHPNLLSFMSMESLIFLWIANIIIYLEENI